MTFLRLLLKSLLTGLEWLGSLVDKVQTFFIRNTFILNNVALALEIITFCHYNHHSILLKLDFEKAFDKVDRNFFCLTFLGLEVLVISGLTGFTLV